jgi:prepilin-type N-terminal cleavage/methylation domain-containing protein
MPLASPRYRSVNVMELKMEITMIRKERGFSLIEMMIVISILGFALAIGTPPLIQFLRHYQSKDAVHIVTGVIRQARSRAIQEKNHYVVYFDIANAQMTILDDDGGGHGNPSNPGFVITNRGNGRIDNGERTFGPYELPEGQVFGLIAGTVDAEGTYVTKAVSFSGNPPRVIFNPNGSTNEEGTIVVMPRKEFSEQKRGTEKMLIVRRSTGSVMEIKPEYN